METTMKWVAALALLLALTACGEDKPQRDPEVWDRAVMNAEIYCMVELPQSVSQYDDEFKNCVKDESPNEYDELMEEGS